VDKYLKKMKKCFFIKNIENEAKEISLPFGTGLYPVLKGKNNSQ